MFAELFALVAAFALQLSPAPVPVEPVESGARVCVGPQDPAGCRGDGVPWTPPPPRPPPPVPEAPPPVCR